MHRNLRHISDSTVGGGWETGNDGQVKGLLLRGASGGVSFVAEALESHLT